MHEELKRTVEAAQMRPECKAVLLAAVELAEAYIDRRNFRIYGLVDFSKGEQSKGVQNLRARERLDAALSHAEEAYREAKNGSKA